MAAACGGSGPSLVANPPTPVLPATPSVPGSTGSPRASSCEAVETIGPYNPETRDAEHILNTARPALSTYTSVPPASGPHASTTMPAGVYDQPVPFDLALHSMEHGAAVIWYDPNADPADIAAVAAFAAANQDHVIMSPFSFPEEGEQGVLPAGNEMALAAWRRLQLCPSMDVAPVASFFEHYRVPTLNGGEYLGEAPEPGFTI